MVATRRRPPDARIPWQPSDGGHPTWTYYNGSIYDDGHPTSGGRDGGHPFNGRRGWLPCIAVGRVATRLAHGHPTDATRQGGLRDLMPI